MTLVYTEKNIWLKNSDYINQNSNYLNLKILVDLIENSSSFSRLFFN